VTAASILSVEQYRTLRHAAPTYASGCKDDLHRRAARGSALAADTLSTLIAEDAWWSRPVRVAPATAALREATGRVPLFEEGVG
jgi:hypothetical protein